MSNYDIIYLGKKAEELGFVRDTLEKVTRLAEMRVSNPNGEDMGVSNPNGENLTIVIEMLRNERLYELSMSFRQIGS